MSNHSSKSISDIAQSAAIGIGTASALSLVIWAVTKQAGVSFETKNELAIGDFTIGAPLILITVVVVSVVAAIGYAVLNRLVADPKKPFQIVTALAGLASFGGPFSEAVETSTLVTLLALHILTAGVTIWSHTMRGSQAASGAFAPDLTRS